MSALDRPAMGELLSFVGEGNCQGEGQGSDLWGHFENLCSRARAFTYLI